MSEIAHNGEQPRQADHASQVHRTAAEGGRRTKHDPPICPTDDESVVPKKKLNKQSVDYLWRSGVAGGLAGCAVSTASHLLPKRPLHRR
jgi:solute carrier family 25 protein 16